MTKWTPSTSTTQLRFAGWNGAANEEGKSAPYQANLFGKQRDMATLWQKANSVARKTVFSGLDQVDVLKQSLVNISSRQCVPQDVKGKSVRAYFVREMNNLW